MGPRLRGDDIRWLRRARCRLSAPSPARLPSASGRPLPDGERKARGVQSGFFSPSGRRWRAAPDEGVLSRPRKRLLPREDDHAVALLVHHRFVLPRVHHHPAELSRIGGPWPAPAITDRDLATPPRRLDDSIEIDRPAELDVIARGPHVDLRPLVIEQVV